MPTPRTTASITAVSRRATLAGLGVGGLGLALAARRASAQDAASEMAGHPIVGSWAWNNNPDTPEAGSSFAIFHADGTYIEFDPAIQVGIGAWRPAGDRSVELSIVFLDNDLDPNTVEAGTGAFWIEIDIDESGNAITANGELQATRPDGSVLVHLPYAGTGTRIVAVAPEWVGTPMSTPAP